MKKWLIPLIVIGVIVFAVYSSAKGFYNASVNLEENAKTAWSNVESAYQRRADLIPNLVSTVKGYAAHEKETLEGVIKARAAATQTTIDPTNITPENMAAFQKAQEGLSGALSRLLVTVEKYPELKANQNFLELQSQLEGTENRINVERNRYNGEVNLFNKHIKTFPNNMLNNFFGNFEEMTRFEAAEGSKVAPKVEF
ncbi:LemA protein [Lutibacter agarilyticus]|uniref:LemA protein n=1 Tax=Lutibacter agarilyticus TaxID=1109740 RepID=A0A238XWN0_9FLAO|nr:LemA family protein [Lutibacter agarilyticus]SNR62764.1 LemA protein [Lutibacter agarilyticus]